MATLSTSNQSLADWAKKHVGTQIPNIAELLEQDNEILMDCVFKEANGATGETVAIRTGLPAVYWRQFNQGVPSSKSTTAQVVEAMGMLEAYSDVDKALADLNGNTNKFRLSEDVAFLEAMNQEQAETMFYGNPSVNPERYLGFGPRYSSLSGGNAQNILDAGGSGSDNTSVYLVVWGDNTVYCPFPKGSKAGLIHEDIGERTSEVVNGVSGNKMQVLTSHYCWKNGLVVKDWRYVVRICNIDVSDLIAQTGTQAESAATNIVKLLSRACDRIQNLNKGKPCFYMNRTVFSGLKLAALDKSNSVLAIEKALTQFGQSRSWLSFEGIPLRKTDALLNTESVVS